ncbi:HNH endonuclease [Devosia sp. 2618]|uniref:HNH endonuclease signature motif containing protein n=1 Tax=Devosia sp. 2618 TaxID=3156454 RepID=UPI00339783CD
MARSVPEWIGKTDDSMPGQLVRDRISAQQGDACKCGRKFGPGVRANCDHIVPLADEGENRESNLQMLCNWCHVEKTSAEATSRAKSRRIRAKHLGLDQATNNRRPSFQSAGFPARPKQRSATREIIHWSERS